MITVQANGVTVGGVQILGQSGTILETFTKLILLRRMPNLRLRRSRSVSSSKHELSNMLVTR